MPALARLFGAALCSTAIGLLAQSPVKVVSRVDPLGNGEAIVTNLQSTPLTAYVLQVFLEPCSPTLRPDVFRVFDALASDGAIPLGASESRTEALGAARCNKVGTSVPARAELRAALYEDGSSFGDARWVEALLETRRAELAQLDAVIEVLRAYSPSTTTLAELTAAVDARLSAIHARPSVLPAAIDVRERTLKGLAAPGASLSERAADTARVLERLRAELLRARPPLR